MPASVDRMSIAFPDPWFQRSHRDRRRLDAALIDGIARVAQPGAEVFIRRGQRHPRQAGDRLRRQRSAGPRA